MSFKNDKKGIGPVLSLVQPEPLPPTAPKPIVPLSQLSARASQLLQMLTYKRPAFSHAETDFIAKFIAPRGAKPDEHGNYWLDVGENPTILFSSHTDTVHDLSGRQNLEYGDNAVTSKSGDCLGADDTTGVWLMLQMVEAGVAGRYVWHQAEEIGGQGSGAAAKTQKHWLTPMKAAIAFDRKGYHDIITHQGSKRCCSDAFAESLSLVLGAVGLKYAACDGGVFTDTANYTGLIGECTNLSVGYFNAHSAKEYQDVLFACDLADALVKADWSKLLFCRTAGAVEYKKYDQSHWADWHNTYASKATNSVVGATGGNIATFGKGSGNPKAKAYTMGGGDQYAMKAPKELERFVYENPGLVADFLYDCGYKGTDLRQYAAKAVFDAQPLGEDEIPCENTPLELCPTHESEVGSTAPENDQDNLTDAEYLAQWGM